MAGQITWAPFKTHPTPKSCDCDFMEFVFSFFFFLILLLVRNELWSMRGALTRWSQTRSLAKGPVTLHGSEVVTRIQVVETSSVVSEWLN